MKNKQTLYRQLVKNENPETLDDLWRELDILSGWPEEESLSLESSDLIFLLERYLSGTLTPAQVENWANYIECASHEAGGIGDDRIVDAIRELANPAIERELTPQSARKMIAQLQEK